MAKLSKAWKIEFAGCLGGKPEDEISGAIVKFRVTFPGGETIFTWTIFSEKFIMDYFGIINEAGTKKLINENIKNEIELFKKWSFVKIEESIEKDFLKTRYYYIKEDDFDWAKKVRYNDINPLSKRIDEGVYNYITNMSKYLNYINN